MAAGPSIFDQIKQAPGAILDALKANYAAGPPQGYPSAGPGSVLDQKNQQLESLLPSQHLVPQAQPLVPQAQSAPDPSAQYGTRPGEKRIDVSEYQKPLSGLSGVKRSK